MDLVSPVTGKLIKISEEQFSPGNMYFELIPRDELERYNKSYTVQMMDGKFLPLPEAYKVLFYYRVYGEKGVIRTGLFGIGADGAFHLN